VVDNPQRPLGIVRLPSVGKEQPAQELLEAGGGLSQAPLLSRCSTSITVMETFGSGSEIVDEKIAEDNLVDDGGVPQVNMVNSLLVEVKVGGDTGEVI
jgi:hypothetical protein